MQNLHFARGFLLLFAPIAPLVTIATSPSLAATFGSSDAGVKINNFSHSPSDILILAETIAGTVATDAIAVAEATNDITVATEPFSANNKSYSLTHGNGNSYVGLAESKATIFGYNFLVEQGQTFSFDFAANLNLATCIEDSQFEVANATGNISLALYNTTDFNNWILVDAFTLAGNIATTGNNDYLHYDAGRSFTLNQQKTTLDTNFGSNQESARASTGGFFSRIFDNLTSLTLVETKTNQAAIGASGFPGSTPGVPGCDCSLPGSDPSVPVPEPSDVLGLLVCIIGLGYRITSKAFRASRS